MRDKDVEPLLDLDGSILDHVHRRPRDQGVPYGYSSALRLLEDFFAAVDRVLELEDRK